HCAPKMSKASWAETDPAVPITRAARSSVARLGPTASSGFYVPRRLPSRQAAAHRFQRRLGPARDVELGIDGLEIARDGLRLEPDHPRGFSDGQPFCDQRQHFGLARAQ